MSTNPPPDLPPTPAPLPRPPGVAPATTTPGGTIVAPVAAPVPTATVPPKRGGIHPTYGVYLGGTALDNDYKLTSTITYRFASQRRHPKSTVSIEKSVMDARASTTTLKFNGKLDSTSGTATELDKERFVRVLAQTVREHGQQTFYWIKKLRSNDVVSLFENYHSFTIKNVEDEFKRRADPSNAAFEAFDDYELSDIGLSRLIVESLLSDAFREKIRVRFSHDVEFEDYPGSVYFMMALDTCNASVSHDVDGAKEKLLELTLDSYPGENVTDCATEALRLIKIMQSAYALEVKTGSMLLTKFTKTSSEFFNRKVYAYLDRVRQMEHKYKLADPKQLEHDAEYAELGPVGIIAMLQKEHGALLSDKEWPALALQLPEANSVNANGKRCFACGSADHLANKCPERKEKQKPPEKPPLQTGPKKPHSKRQPLADWKYVRPTDLKQTKKDEKGQEWKFCTKCKCRVTGRQGIYNLSHFDHEHKDDFKKTKTQANLSSLADPDSGVPFGPPQSTMKGPPDDDPDAIEFHGMWCAPIADASLEVNVSVASVSPARSTDERESAKVKYHFDDVECHEHKDLPGPSVPTPTSTAWFFVPSILDLFGHFLQLLIHFVLTSANTVSTTFWHAIRVPVFFAVTMFWDSMAWLLVSSSPGPPRRLRRASVKRQNIALLSLLPAAWMVMSSAILVCNSAYQGSVPVHPFSAVKNEICETYHRIHLLEQRVELTWDVLRQFNLIKVKQLASDLHDALDEEADATSKDAESTSNAPQTEDFDLFRFEDLTRNVHSVDCRQDASFFPAANHAPTMHAITGLTTAEMLASDPHALLGIGDLRRPVIFDTGASLAITFDKSDFDTPLSTTKEPRYLGGMANGLRIEGHGDLTWKFTASDGSELRIRTTAYYVPSAKARLLSPQRLFNKTKGVRGFFRGDGETFKLALNDLPSLEVPYDTHSHLPIALATVGDGYSPQINIAVLSDENQNLTGPQKLLLEWHSRFGHLNMARIQSLFRHAPFVTDKFIAAAKSDPPKCMTCEIAKARRRPTHSSNTKPVPERDGALKSNHLSPGAAVSVDHFESRLKGRTNDSYGKLTSDQYVGGCIFVDHASGYMHVEHQLGFSAVETIRAKQNFEKFAFDTGVIVQEYLTDSGAFKANKFVSHIKESQQKIRYCGTNAHHQNGVAERAIQSVSNMARAMLLHSSLHWKGGIDSSLWPQAVHYATHIYNTTPDFKGLCPADVFTGSTVPRHRLRDFHVWGCPVYILDPKLQAGKKLPRWEPRSRRGIFVGLSNVHSSEVPLVVNLQTGSITSQFHVVFDDRFSTVASIERENEPPDHWDQLCLENSISIPVEKDSAAAFLDDGWLSPAEREKKRRELERLDRLRPIQTHRHVPIPPSTATRAPTTRTAEVPVPPAVVEPPPTSEGATVPDPPSAPVPPAPDPRPSGTSTPPPAPPPIPAVPPPMASSEPPPDVSHLRRSSRSTKGMRTTPTFEEEFQANYVSDVFIPQTTTEPTDGYHAALAYQAELLTNIETSLIDGISDPRVYAAKKKKDDPDMPRIREALKGENSEEYLSAMKKEVAALVAQRTWITVPRSQAPKVLKSTWAFKLKRLPDGTPYRFKARFCVRGDMQTEGVDYFETYSPVVQWSTTRLLLSLVLQNQWHTKQVDYTNAFAQAELEDDVYVEPPQLFGPKSGKDLVLKLLKSLYGLKQAPRTFYQKLSDGLIERGFRRSDHDPCLFLKKDMICIIYVDDTIFAGKNPEDLEAIIKSLGVSDHEQRHSFTLRDEGEVGDFLGIRIEKVGERTFKLTQLGLIEKVLQAAGMVDCRGVPTPATTTPVGTDIHGDKFSETWDYSSVIGMLMYLAGNTRPDIAYAVHQAARFTHNPKDSHAVAVKRILRYLKATSDKGIFMSPSDDWNLECYVDSDFGGLFNVEHDQDPVCVKSRTGYVIMFCNIPILWISKLQTQVALSTMEAEYIALSQSMRDLIPLREILKEIKMHVFDSNDQDTSYSTYSKAFSDVEAGNMDTIPQSVVYEDNAACLKFARMPKLSPRTKHIAIPYHWFRTQVERLEIAVEPVSTDKQLADQFTKGLPADRFESGRKALMGW